MKSNKFSRSKKETVNEIHKVFSYNGFCAMMAKFFTGWLHLKPEKCGKSPFSTKKERKVFENFYSKSKSFTFLEFMMSFGRHASLES